MTIGTLGPTFVGTSCVACGIPCRTPLCVPCDREVQEALDQDELISLREEARRESLYSVHGLLLMQSDELPEHHIWELTLATD